VPNVMPEMRSRERALLVSAGDDRVNMALSILTNCREINCGCFVRSDGFASR
jgi:hypothetical protein